MREGALVWHSSQSCACTTHVRPVAQPYTAHQPALVRARGGVAPGMHRSGLSKCVHVGFAVSVNAAGSAAVAAAGIVLGQGGWTSWWVDGCGCTPDMSAARAACGGHSVCLVQLSAAGALARGLFQAWTYCRRICACGAQGGYAAGFVSCVLTY